MPDNNPPADQPVKQPGEKEFSLKPIQLQMIRVLQDTYFTNLSNFLSFIAVEFLGYQVTESTQFKVEEGKLFISEKTPEPAAEGEVVSTGADTAQAIGGKDAAAEA